MGVLGLLVLGAVCVAGALVLLYVFTTFKPVGSGGGGGGNGSGGNGIGGGGGNGSGGAQAPDPATEEGLFRATQQNSERLMAHLKAKHGADARTRRLVSRFRSLRMLPKSAVDLYGRFGGSTIEVSMWETRSTLRTMASINNTLVHEMGHAIEADEAAGHGPRWRAAYMWVADIASRELGWPIRISCSDCARYDTCSPSLCPQCQRECPRR